MLTADPSNPGYQQTAGEARSQGFDLQFSGQLTEQLRLIGAYAYIDAEVTRMRTSLAAAACSTCRSTAAA